MSTLATLRALQQTVANQPDDPDLRRIFADSLEESGQVPEAWLQRYLGGLTPEALAHLFAFRRPGVFVKAGLDWIVRDEGGREAITSRVQEIFLNEPQIQFALCGEVPPETAGFVEMALAPAVYWDLRSNHVREVAPANLSPAQRTAVGAFARETTARTSAPVSRAFGQASRPRWT